MATLRHAIEGILLIVSAFYLAEVLKGRGIGEQWAQLWSSVFIVAVGGCIIWLHRRGRKPPA